ncbi:hypothetical protein [Methanopyrus sp.]
MDPVFHVAASYALARAAGYPVRTSLAYALGINVAIDLDHFLRYRWVFHSPVALLAVVVTSHVAGLRAGLVLSLYVFHLLCDALAGMKGAGTTGVPAIFPFSLKSYGLKAYVLLGPKGISWSFEPVARSSKAKPEGFLMSGVGLATALGVIIFELLGAFKRRRELALAPPV